MNLSPHFVLTVTLATMHTGPASTNNSDAELRAAKCTRRVLSDTRRRFALTRMAFQLYN